MPCRFILGFAASGERPVSKFIYQIYLHPVLLQEGSKN